MLSLLRIPWISRGWTLAVPCSRAQAQQLWYTELVAPQCVGSSQVRDGTCVSCIGRQGSLPLSRRGSPC